MSLANYTELFRSESREHITAINHLLLALEANPAGREPIEGIFRAVHTIKGMAATMGCGGVADLAHEMETVLDRVRQGSAAVHPALLDVVFRAVDAIEAGVEAWAETGESPVSAGLLAELRVLLIDRVETAAAAPAGQRSVRVRAVVGPDAPMPGVRAFMLVRKARELGEVVGLEPAEDGYMLASFGGEVRFALRSALAADEVQRALSGVGDLAELDVSPLSDAPNPVTGPSAPAAATTRHVRVDPDRLDSLLDRVGELVIVRDRLVRASTARHDEPLADAVDLIGRLIGQLRDEVLEIRMVPVREIFDRFPRLVRDAARGLGKKVVLEVDGDDIEVDRSLLERIGDPLVHLLRNAIDHGIEPPAERLALGKPETGRLKLSARRERSRVLIRVEDDGRGIDRERIVRKAIALGLITDASAVATDEAALDLITRPGMSTAERVTEVSGRGVGLDVVATQVRGLRGTLEIASRPDEGTAFTMRLPASVGLMRAVLVSVCGSTYAIPIAHVSETVEFWAGQVHEMAGSRVAFLREEALPLISLRELLGGAAPSGAATPERVPVVVVELEDQPFGLAVDGLLGQQEVVTKPFDATRGTLPLFAGATILSDGHPALMLDAAAVVRHGRLHNSFRVQSEER